MFFVSTSPQLVDASLFDFPGTGSAEDEVQAIFHHQFVNNVQKFRELLDFIYDDQCLWRILHQHLVEIHRTALEAFPRIRVKEINVYGFGEALSQKR